MDALTLFGLVAVTAMLIFYALEDRSPWYVLAFVGRVRARLALRISAGGLAFWRRRGRMGGDSRPTVANEGDQPLEASSEKRLVIGEAALARRMRSRHMTGKPVSPCRGRRLEPKPCRRPTAAFSTISRVS